MPETTITEAAKPEASAPAPASPSPSGTFALSKFGAVSLIKKTAVTIPPDVRAALAEVPAMLAQMANTYKIHLDLRGANPAATEKDAADFRAWIKAYADENDLNAYVPVFVDGHWSRKDADANGNYTDSETGQVRQAKWIAPNDVDKSWNTGHDITFRLTYKKPAAESQNGEVTTTQAAPRAGRRASRGQQTLSR